MQKVQNNFTVEALVAKYRNYVNEHCPKSENVSFDDNGEMFEYLVPISPYGEADEQLIVTLYKKVAGVDADVQIVDALSQYAEKFYCEALTEDEMSFMCKHFPEVVSYEFAHRNEWLSGDSGQRISEERIRLIKEFVKPKKGAKIFIAEAGYGDIAVLFPECVISGFTGSEYKQKVVWALGQIRLFVAGIQSEIVPGEDLESIRSYSYEMPAKESMDVVVFVGYRYNPFQIKDLEALYGLLEPNGNMLFFLEYQTEMVGKKEGRHDASIFDFRARRVKEKAISTIVAYEDDHLFSDWKVMYIMLELRKGENSNVYIKDEVRSRAKYINADELDPDILWPSYYWANHPTNGVPLSSIVRFSDEKINEDKELAEFVGGDNGWILHEKAKDMQLVLPALLGDSYKDANLIQKVNQNVCAAFEEKQCVWFGLAKEPCVLLWGRYGDLKVGYTTKAPDGGFAYVAECCIVPREGIDVRYIAALLFEPSVKEQILTICDGDLHRLPRVMDKIIVPNHGEKERLAFLAEANYDALLSSQEELKQEAEHYKKSVRMRKHALTQSLSAIESMFYALNAYRLLQNGRICDDDIISRVTGTSVREAFDFISKNLEDMMPALEHIAAVDYSFDKPEWIDPEIFIENYIKRNENGWLNFKPIMMWEKGHNHATEDIRDPLSGDIILTKGNSIRQFLFPKDALERVFNNIISNAQAHGFDNKSRNDYQLRFSWHMEGLALVVEIDNNGSPIPNDRDTASLLEYGVSTALHHDGHNGIGCNEIVDIMQRYDGNVEIVSSPEDEFPVKYILTFNRSNMILSL